MRENASAIASHPLAGQSMSGAEIVVQVLVDEGCRVVFGYSGGAILPVYDAVFRYNQEHLQADGREPLPLIVPANEQGAGFMASGYARASGDVGVVMVTSGPGATNLVTPVRDAMADSIPMVAICGQVPTTSLGSDAFQEAPVSNIMSACAKHVFLVTDATRLESTLRTAFEIARSGRPGPVVIDIPKNLQNTPLHFDGSSRLPIPGYRARLEQTANAQLSVGACEQLFAALAAAKRPLLYAGGGVISANATQALREFVESFGLPVATTLMGFGVFDTSHPFSLHMLGMHGTAYANYAVEDCDFLMAVGARFDDRVAGVPDKFAPKAKFIAQLDIDPAEVGKAKTVNWSHIGPLVDALEKLTRYGKAHGAPLHLSDWQAEIATLKREHPMNFDRDNAKIQPPAVIEAVNRHTHGRAIVATGVGQHQMFAAQYLEFHDPRHWVTSGSMGTMGFGLPAAIGAQFACPDALVIDIDGDGSIRMNVGELETVTTYDLPVKVMLFNNGCDGMIRQWQKLYFGKRMASSDKSLRRKDFVKAAQADGFTWVKRLSDPAQLDATVAEFLAFKGPAFLEVMVDPDAMVFPMIGPGKGYADMVVGDFIPGRASETATPEQD